MRIPAFIVLLAVSASTAFAQSGPVRTVDPGDLKSCTILMPEGVTAGNFVLNTWPRGVVPYAFSPNVDAPNRVRTLSVMSQLQGSGGVYFVARDTEASYLFIQSSNRNASYVGRVSASAPQPVEIVNWDSPYIVAHELLHALGFVHEQQRSDRDSYVQINYPNIQSGYSAANFDIWPGAIAFPNGQYDFDSVMQYGRCAVSVCCALGTECNCAETCQTITPRAQNIAWQQYMGQRDHLSTTDFIVLAALYSRVCGVGVNDHIQVGNTQGLGLKVRSCPGLSVNCTQIGSKPDGSTGVILDGPREADGYRWWNIRWDSNALVGWSAEGEADLSACFLLLPQPSIDRSAPLVNISAPVDREVFSARTISVAGTSTDNIGYSSGIELVQVRVNAEVRQTASGTGQWSTTVDLSPGDNIIRAQAFDYNGFPSPVPSIVVTYLGCNPPNCDDNNDCTSDSCVSNQCQNAANSAPCYDGLFCNGADTCSNRSCSLHAGNPCPGPDGDGNCSESCNETSGNCLAADPNGSGCNDGAFCNGTDTCSNGNCSQHAGDPCPGADGDGNCAETCNEGQRACNAPDPNGSLCNDGNTCTANDVCSGGTCVGSPSPSCPCFNQPDNTPCDDGVFCNGNETCSSGQCLAGAEPCGPNEDCDEDANECIPTSCIGPPADFDCDGDVDLGDFGLFQPCMSDPDVSPAVGCGASDLDGDGDVDLRDFSIMQNAFTGDFTVPPLTPNWTDISTTTRPPNRRLHAMAYDAAQQQLVLFGGTSYNAPGAPFGDTWLLNGTSWTQANTPSAPAPRIAHAMTYDSIRHRVVLFGGYNFGSPPNPWGDTWEWDGVSWTQKSTSGPVGRWFTAMAFDIAGNRVILFGGYKYQNPNWVPLDDTWAWNGTAWTQVPATGPSARTAHAIAYDAARGQIVLFGGISSVNQPIDDTWVLSGNSWIPKFPPQPRPAARLTHALAYDAARQRVVLFGGSLDANGSVVKNDTWEWDGSVWTQQSPSRSPSERQMHALAYDSDIQRIILFGGIGLDDTWEYGN